MKKLFNGRFSTLFGVLSLYVFLSFMVRIILLIWSVKDLDLKIMHILRAFFTGFAFDLTMGSLFLALYTVYLLLIPRKWIGSLFDKCFTYFYLSLLLFIIYFSLLAEIPFWEEFGVRFNFIAVDYLIYTYEVFENIDQSYPLPFIGAVLIGLIVLTFFLFKKLDIFKNTFSVKNPIRHRLIYAVPVLAIAVVLGLVMKNKQADFTDNLVVNELGKNGAFSFVSAYQSNELDYGIFYPTLPEKEAYSVLKQDLLQDNLYVFKPI